MEFGSERLVNVVQTFSALNSSAMLFSILAALENFVGRGHREDAISLAVLRRLDSSEMDWERDGSERNERNGSERYVV